ncbi:MAG: MFS transporter, partial [Acidimicrobiales bacterium]
VGVCFIANAASFVAVVYSLATLDPAFLRPSPPTRRARGQLREGLSYVWNQPRLVIPLVMMAIIGTLAYEFSVVLPVVAKQTFHGGATAYGFMNAAMGIGAVAGGLVTAARGSTGMRPLVTAAAAFGVTIFFAAIAPGLGVELVALGIVGFASVSFLATGNTTLQLEAEEQMRGRVMSLWAVAFLGSTPIGGPVMGLIVGAGGGRAGLFVGAAACLAAAALGASWVMRHRHEVLPGSVDETLAGPEVAEGTLPAT